MPRAASSRGWQRTWIVALREIRERGRSRAYVFSTVLGVVLMVGVMFVPSLLEPSDTYRVGLTGSTAAGTVTALEAQARAVDREVTVTRYDTLEEGERAARAKEVDVLLVDSSNLEWRTRADSTLTAAIANAVQSVRIRESAEQLGITPTQLAQLLVPVALGSRTLGAAQTDDPDANLVGFIAVGLMYVAISIYAGSVLSGVVQEKANRVAEVLLARMPAREILAGKVLGIGAVGLAQLVHVQRMHALGRRGGAHVLQMLFHEGGNARVAQVVQAQGEAVQQTAHCGGSVRTKSSAAPWAAGWLARR